MTDRSQLIGHLTDSGICGDVATPREGNLRNIARCAERDPHYTFGLELEGRWDYADIVDLMARRVGIEADLDHRFGQDRIVGGRLLDLRHLGGVAMVSNGASLEHTHDPDPMQAMLAALRADGQLLPDLVVADHGYAGAAGQAGIPTVGFADCNDPALFVGEAEGRIEVTVGLDDNVLPHLYAPVSAFLLAGWG